MDYQPSKPHLTIHDCYAEGEPAIWLSITPGDYSLMFQIVKAYEDLAKDQKDGGVQFCMLKPSDVLVMAAYLKQMAENLLQKEAEFALEEEF